MAKVTGAAAGRDLLRNHSHTRGVCWLGRSFLPTDFPDPDRPCERNPGPPTGVSSFQRRVACEPKETRGRRCREVAHVFRAAEGRAWLLCPRASDVDLFSALIRRTPRICIGRWRKPMI